MADAAFATVPLGGTAIGRLAASRGWRGALLSKLLGVLGTAALPPFGLVPLLLPAFAGLFLQLEAAPRPRSAFAAVFWFALAHFATGLYWISNAMFVDIARFWWMVPPTALGLPTLFALMAGSVFAAYPLLRPSSTTGRVLLFAALWSAAELFRAWFFTGFPWNATGYAWIAVPPVAQAASVIGVFGLGFLTAAVSAACAAGWRGAGFGLGILALIAAAGGVRLSGATDAVVEGATLRLVQPGIQQTLKWAPEVQAANFARHVELSRRPAERPLAAVIWPETATTFALEEHAEGRAIAASLAPEAGLFISGTPRILRNADGSISPYNGLIALDRAGSLRAAYDKFHLVPFGEYVPGRGLLPIEKIAAGRGDWQPGPGPRTVALPGLPPASPLICYEVIFPGAVVDPESRPAWLLNVTNDAWFGMSAGPYQHFAQARMRAIEEGLPLARAANTGISGMVDAYGRVTARLGLGEVGIVDADLPAALDPTPYSRLRDWPLGALLVLILLVAARARAARQ